MSNKTKLFVIGSTITAALGGFFIYGPSDQQVQATALKEGYTLNRSFPLKVIGQRLGMAQPFTRMAAP